MQQADVNVSGPGVQRLAWQRACAPDLRPLDLWKRHAHDLHCAFGQCYCHKPGPFCVDTEDEFGHAFGWQLPPWQSRILDLINGKRKEEEQKEQEEKEGNEEQDIDNELENAG